MQQVLGVSFYKINNLYAGSVFDIKLIIKPVAQVPREWRFNQERRDSCVEIFPWSHSHGLLYIVLYDLVWLVIF